jgi:hypothetical protein
MIADGRLPKGDAPPPHLAARERAAIQAPRNDGECKYKSDDAGGGRRAERGCRRHVERFGGSAQRSLGVVEAEKFTNPRARNKGGCTARPTNNRDMLRADNRSFVRGSLWL